MAIETKESVLAGTAQPAWDNTAMSSTNKRVTDALTLGDRCADVGWNIDWSNTGSVTGAFDVEETNDDPAAGSPRWTSLPSADKELPTVSNSVGPAMIRARVRGNYARLVYTNASGTGVLETPRAHGKASR